MNTKTKEGARNKGNPYFLRVPWNKGGLVNTGPGLCFKKGFNKDISLPLSSFVKVTSIF